MHNRLMKRATMTVPDDLAEAVDNHLRAQEIPPTLTAIVQTVLKEKGSTCGNEGFCRCVGP